MALDKEHHTKFTTNELVLCYEPDPSKAKMLYDAKILDVDVTRDEKGRRVSEYYVHFQGWNKSWDRWVLENQILKVDESGRQIQSKLYKEAIKPKKKRKPKPKSESEDEKDDKSVTSLGSVISNEDGDTKVIQLPMITLDIPKSLALRLEDDCYNIKRKKKLIHLPRRPSVTDVFNDYYSACEAALNTSEGKHTNMQIVQEMLEGLHTYFNFTLTSLLLYNFERDQYDQLFPDQNPFKLDTVKEENLPTTPTNHVPSTPTRVSARIQDSNKTPKLKRPLTRLTSPPLSRASSPALSRQSSICGDETVGDVPATNPSSRGSTRETRSSLLKKDSPIKTRDRDELLNPPLESNSPSKLSRLADEKSESTIGSLRRSARVVRNSESLSESNHSDTAPDFCEQDVSQDALLPIGSSAKTLQRTTRMGNSRAPLTSCKSSKDSSFMAFPQQENGDTPADIYGPEHLLRLFVKLPALLASTNMEDDKLNVLLQYATKFLGYMSERADLFSDNVYSESIL